MTSYWCTTSYTPRRGRRVMGLALGAAALLALSACGSSGGSAAGGAGGAGTAVTIGLATPLSGAFAQSGKDEQAGAQLAVDQINSAGGIAAIGGAKLKLDVVDAGDTPQQATTAARQMLNTKPVAAMGCWYSSLTLAATQISEQAKIPWITGSASDDLVGRGFKYTYQISEGINQATPEFIKVFTQLSKGAPVRLAVLQDNNVASTGLVKTLGQQLPGGTAAIVSDQIWTPPLADATPPVTAVLQANPTVIFIEATSTTDQTQVLKQLKAQGNTAPVVMGASSAVNPSFLQSVGAEGMQGIFVPSSVAFPGKGSDSVVKAYTAATGQPYMGSEAFEGYSDVWVIKEALESARSADPQAVKAALDSMKATGVPALALLPSGSTVSFQPNGRRAGTAVELLQWQNGLPKVLSPADVANGSEAS
jgi:branched-chain amino acid transport system substrate-binding protein